MPLTILVVDNNSFFLEALDKFLSDAGHAVTTCADPLDAIEFVRTHAFDVVFIDHVMPTIDGESLCRLLRCTDAGARARIVIMTGLAEELQRTRDAFTADAFIAKNRLSPFLDNVRDVLDRLDAGDDTLRMQVVGIEQIPRREMTGELIQIRNHLRRILGSMSEGIIECDGSGRIFFANAAALALLGEDEDHIIGRRLTDMLAAVTDGALREIAEHDPRYVRIAGRHLRLSVTGITTDITEDGILLFIDDVTELSRKIGELSAINQFASTMIMQAAPHDVISNVLHAFADAVPADTSLFVRFEQSSPPVTRIEGILGRNVRIAPGDGVTATAIAGLVTAGAADHVVLTGPAATSLVGDMADRLGYAPGRATIIPLFFRSRCIGVVLQLDEHDGNPRPAPHDIILSLTSFSAVAIENAYRLEALHEMDIWRQNLMANISHELRTPLTIVKGFTELLLGRASGGDDEGMLRSMLAEEERLARQIDSMLTMSRFENIPATRKIARQPIDLNVLVGTVCAPLIEEARARDVTLAVDREQQDVWVAGEPALLAQSIRHVLSNAIEHTGPGGHVSVSTKLASNLAFVTVRDTGVGIPEEKLDSVFDKYYMIDDGISRQHGGTGIGLYLVREIVNLHNGNVQLRSTVGRGTVVQLKLPALPQGQ